MICIYHSRDLDGWMSAAIVRLIYPNVELIGWDYGQDLPAINPYNADVIMVDISFPIHNMRHLQEKNYLIWIDHHLSAIKEMENAALDPNGKRDVKKAACELTWEYFHKGKMPEIVRLLGRYDCFGHKGTDEELKILEFQYGARQEITGVEDAFIILSNSLNNAGVEMNILNRIWTKGKAIYEYLCTEAKGSYKKIFPIELDGYKFACINQERFNPINFGIDYHKDGYDGFACFWYANGRFSYSLYNDNGLVNCSVIAKNRGGGGHKGASGFVSDTIIK